MRDGSITNNLHDACRVSVVILKHSSRLYRPEALHSGFGFCTTIGMGLSQRGAINGLVWREMTSLGISLCDAYLRWGHTWVHTSAESGTRPPATAEVTVARNLQEKRTSWESKLGCQRGKMTAKSSADSLLFPIYHSFIQVKVIRFPDLALWIKWTNLPPPHFSHKGVILLIVCCHVNSVCVFQMSIFVCWVTGKENTRPASSGPSSHPHKPVT